MSGVIQTTYLAFKNQPNDFFTKSIPSHACMRYLLSNLGVLNLFLSTSLRGDDNNIVNDVVKTEQGIKEPAVKILEEKLVTDISTS